MFQHGEKMKLSIIIPIYNVEKYISLCLDSLLRQNIPSSDYEIIVIDDGSTDTSQTIVRDYASKYSNISLYMQENAGPGAARNIGIDRSQGEYIWFVDGDDTIQENCLKDLLQYIYRLDVDLCLCSYRMVYKTSSWQLGDYPSLFNKVVCPVDILKRRMFPVGVAFYLVRRRVLEKHGLYFISKMYHEDLEFNIRMVEHCKRISYFDDKKGGLYYYVQERIASTMTNPSVEHILKRIDGYCYILKSIYKNYFSVDGLNSNSYAYHMNSFANQIMISFLFPLIKGVQLKEKSAFYKALITNHDLRYNVNVETGLSYYKFRFLSYVRTSYRLTLLLLTCFDLIGSWRHKLLKKSDEQR